MLMFKTTMTEIKIELWDCGASFCASFPELAHSFNVNHCVMIFPPLSPAFLVFTPFPRLCVSLGVSFHQ